MRGHQTPSPAAPREVHLNNLVDPLANAAHTSSEFQGSTPVGYGIMLYIDGEPITGKYGGAIHHAATSPEIGQYYQRKHGWTHKTLQTIDWDAFGRAQKRFTTLQQRNLHKYVHDWLPTGEVQDRRYKTKSKCPLCPNQDTRDHMRQCPTNSSVMEEFYSNLERQLTKWKTEPGLARLWLTSLKGDALPYRGTEKNSQWIQQLQDEQHTLGHKQMWSGFISQKWGDVQEAYHRREKHNQTYTGKRWATTLVHSLWTLALSLWKKRVQALHRATQLIPPHQQALIKQIRNLYVNLRDTPNILSGLFKHDLRQLTEKPTKYLSRWLRIALRVPLNETINLQRRKHNGQDIRKYLPMASHPPDA